MSGSASARITGLDEDMAALEQRFKAALAGALPVLGKDMVDCLAEHIQSDVYGADFFPTDYERRGENGGLLDMNGNTTVSPVGDNGIQMDYEPSGEVDPPDKYGDQDYLDGDALIGRIEHLNPDYNWTRHPPARPFFENFVKELVEGGRAEETLVRAMNQQDAELQIEANGYTGREGDEGY